MPIHGVLPIPGLQLNVAGACAQVEPVPVPMHQRSLALGGKPRPVDRRVVAVALAPVAASIPGPRPTPRPRFATVTELVPLVGSWCLCLCWVVVHSSSEEPTPSNRGLLSRCTLPSLIHRFKLAFCNLAPNHS